MRRLRGLNPQRACCRHVELIHLPGIRTFYSSNRLYDIRFPHGVPAFPISPPKQYKTRPLPAYRDVRPNTTRNIIVFLSICGAWTVAAMMAINYERFASPVTASTLHEVRKSPKARELLGKDIQHRCMHPAYKGWYRYDGWFRQPWISGSIQLTKGIIDVAYDVKGSDAEGRVHFVSTRPDKFSNWDISEWTVTSYKDGRTISLLDEDHAIPVPEES